MPESPEAVALFLLCLILERCGTETGSNQLPHRQIISIFNDCLRAARGEENVSHGLTH